MGQSCKIYETGGRVRNNLIISRYSLLFIMIIVLKNYTNTHILKNMYVGCNPNFVLLNFVITTELS